MKQDISLGNRFLIYGTELAAFKKYIHHWIGCIVR